MQVTVEGKQQDMPIMQVHLESHKLLDDSLDEIRLEYVPEQRPPKFHIKKEHMGVMELESINSENDPVIFAKTFSLYGIPAQLPYAWIYNVFSVCSQVQMWIKPVPKDEAITRMVRFKNIIYEDSKSDRMTAELYKRADETEHNIKQEETGLYECIVNCTVAADTRKKLNENIKLFRKGLRKHGGSFASVLAKQATAFQEGYGKKITLDRGSCAILYSFVSADMLEIPNGIPLGINMISKGPVIFDIAKRTNYNIAVIGKSGSGKSFTVKILLNRLHQKFPDSHIYVIDPMGEYGKIASFLRMESLNVTKDNEKLGWTHSSC